MLALFCSRRGPPFRDLSQVAPGTPIGSMFVLASALSTQHLEYWECFFPRLCHQTQVSSPALKMATSTLKSLPDQCPR
jgi:hypothetical protein